MLLRHSLLGLVNVHSAGDDAKYKTIKMLNNDRKTHQGLI